MTASPIALLHRDTHLLVADKPAGLLTVPGKGPDKQDCLLNRLLADFPNSRIVHRLDQPTSGLVIIPQNYQSLRHIGQQFERRQVDKRYIAVVTGLMAQDSGEVDLPLICDWPNRPRQIVDSVQGKPALTHYRVLSRDIERKRTRVVLTPVTGRSHQLRVHMLALGHPIVGDTLYAPTPVASASPRLLLHAEFIRFTHPDSGEAFSVTQAAPF